MQNLTHYQKSTLHQMMKSIYSHNNYPIFYYLRPYKGINHTIKTTTGEIACDTSIILKTQTGKIYTKYVHLETFLQEYVDKIIKDVQFVLSEPTEEVASVDEVDEVDDVWF